MKRWSWRRMRILLLAVLLGLGMSVSFVQGSVMTAAMAVAADGAHQGPGDCGGCGGGDHKGADAGTCLSVCGSAAQGLISGDPLTPPATSRTDFELAYLLLTGETNRPDHGPPKTLTLG